MEDEREQLAKRVDRVRKKVKYYTCIQICVISCAIKIIKQYSYVQAACVLLLNQHFLKQAILSSYFLLFLLNFSHTFALIFMKFNVRLLTIIEQTFVLKRTCFFENMEYLQ